MATYKLIQDIEAEDHILGPLSLRQFLFALGAALMYYISFYLYTKGGAFLLVATLPVAFFLTFFAFPFGKDQSTEVWALAKLRFLFKPRKRVWDQTGMKELVTITVPKKIERVLTNGLDQTEVKSRLNALANTIDSRGWAIKNVSANGIYASQDPMQNNYQSDRLVQMSTMPQQVPSYAPVMPYEDIMDTASNPVAHQFDQMITQTSQQHHQQLVDRMNAPADAQSPVTDYWFMQQEQQPAPQVAPQQDSQSVAAEQSYTQDFSQPQNDNLRTLDPVTDDASQQQTIPMDLPEPPVIVLEPPVTHQPDPAILNLANNDDLNVATLAREAQKAKHHDLPEDEVVISLR